MAVNGRRAVVLVEDLYEDIELWYPVLRLREEGVTVSIVGPRAKTVYRGKYGYPVTSDSEPAEVDAETIDAVIIPGGYAPDRMRRSPEMVRLVRDVQLRGGIVAFICHGGWMPISADILAGRRATSFHSIKDDMTNAGALWLDASVVRDGNLISSRNPDDLPDFCRTVIEALSERPARVERVPT